MPNYLSSNRAFPLLYRVVFMMIALLGVILNTKMFTTQFNITTLLYYTTQSNILAVALFAYLSVLSLKDIVKRGLKGDRRCAPKLTFILMVDILLTLIVFWVLLAPTMVDSEYQLYSFANLAVHTITPLAIIGEYFLFNTRDKVTTKIAFSVLIYPLIYVIFALVVGAFKWIRYYAFGVEGHPTYFPYFFLDFFTQGWWVVLYIFAIAVLLMIVSFVFKTLIHRHQNISLNKEQASD